MAYIKKLFLLAIIVSFALSAIAADTLQPLDLKPFINTNSPVEKMGAQWLVPHGPQVLDGVPFQIDGTILTFGSNSTQRGRAGRGGVTNVTITKVPPRFERLHFLGASDTGGSNSISAGNIHFFYTDDSDSVFELRHGEQLRSWLGALHKPELPLTYPEARQAWVGQHSGAAQTDKYLRFYHVVITNPAPEKDIRSIAIESPRTQYGLLVLGLTVGPANAEKLPDTIAAPKNPFPDTRPRNGGPTDAHGVVESMDGKPISNAYIRVLAARDFNTEDRTSTEDDPAVGTTVAADSSGQFTLPNLPDNRIYRIIAIADGFQPYTYRGMDPKSDPIEIRLKRLDTNQANGKFAIHARVIGPDGKPVSFASVEPQGVATGDQRSWGGQREYFPEQVFTDTKGEFTLSSGKEFTEVQVRVKALKLADNMVWLNITNHSTNIEMNAGAIVRGRVLKDGKPLADLRVSVSDHDRNAEYFMGNFSTRTGTDGTFVFEHLPINMSWDFYGPIGEFKKFGALRPRMIESTGVGQTTDLGDVPVVPGLRLSGQVKTRNGEPPPKGLRLNVSDQNYNNSDSVAIGDDGTFVFDGLSATGISIYLSEEGWRLSSANRSLDQMNPGRLRGQLSGDKDDLIIELERHPGDNNFYGYSVGNGYLPPQDQPDNRPLFGAEPNGPPCIMLAGHVVDDKTGAPITSFKMTPGRQPPIRATPARPKTLVQELAAPFKGKTPVPYDERIHWEYPCAEDITNGYFSAPFIVLSSQPIMRIEAPGYSPLVTPVLDQTDTNLVLRLKKGINPNGIILLPDGIPANKATLVLAGPGEQFPLKDTSLSLYANERDIITTRKDGKFSVPAKTDEATLYVAHYKGWAEQVIPVGGGDELKIRLKPWAAISGILMDSNGLPAGGIELSLTMFHDWKYGNGPLINLQQKATTDAQGHFFFTNVPPARVEIQRMVAMTFPGMPKGFRGGGMTYQMQTWLIAEPGITNDIGKITLDKPPPEPMMDQLKTKLGL